MLTRKSQPYPGCSSAPVVGVLTVAGWGRGGADVFDAVAGVVRRSGSQIYQ
ncbi:Uncharacterised protein [Actinomyces bovis]|uniref:Uncharacterized protein n=1 Tax=Actinomyces bovis TaxID=1658 RepID=A0ABY1VLY5_9ACTO|nr:hypothetical protein [Actinomyces bovis]SPT52929.1 Uncharacterised protein [Actinomyces bovis]VEG55097.1 Uncharacterised protein [Actinomyces israelii]